MSGSRALAMASIRGAENDGTDVPGPTPNAWVSSIEVYKGGESKLEGVDRVIKLSSNENPLGPSPRAIEAYRRAADDLSSYPDGAAANLRGAIAATHGIDADRIVCGAGSDELIALLCQAFCAPGDEVLHTVHGFAMYAISARASGATPIAAPETDLRADPKALLNAVTSRTRIVFLANPNNPTGSYLTRDELTAFVEALPPRVLLVLDGAYAEYMRAADYESGLALVDKHPNVAVTRTFSKIHGLAALRLGWAYAPGPIARALHQVRGPFNASAPALIAGEAAVRDTDYAEGCAIQNEVWRDWLAKRFRELGVAVPPAAANFLLPEFGASGPTSSQAADMFLRSRGILARQTAGYGLPGHLRITVGSASECVAVARAVADFMRGGGGDGAAG